MADHNRLQPRDISLLQAWIADLLALGYLFPPVIGEQNSPPAQVASEPPSDAAWLINGGLDGAYSFPQQWCTRLDTMLVINVNRPDTDVMKKQFRLLHAIYRPHYKRVLFAGSEDKRWVQPEPRLQQLMDQGYLLNCGNHTIRGGVVGFFMYACVAEGVLAAQHAVWRPDKEVEPVSMFLTNDDVVYSPCMAQHLNYSMVWYPDNLSNLTELSSMTGWHWDIDSGEHGLTSRQATSHALASAWGQMAPLVEGRLRPMQVVTNNWQGDVYYVPARHMQMFAKLAAHFQSYWVMSEAAIPNILSLLVDGPEGNEVVRFAMAWDGARGCWDGNIKQILPLRADINQTAVRSCGAHGRLQMMTDDEHGKEASMFAIHPVKLSNVALTNHCSGWFSQLAELVAITRPHGCQLHDA